MTCEVEGCDRPVNRDGLCFPHKMGSVHFNGGYRLAKEREGGYTQAELQREIVTEAKASGTDIQQRRGRRSATEVHRNGKWEKV